MTVADIGGPDMTRRKWPLWRNRERNYVHKADHSGRARWRALTDELEARDYTCSATTVAIGGSMDLACTLPRRHAGAHRDRDGAEWTFTDAEAVAILDADDGQKPTSPSRLSDSVHRPRTSPAFIAGVTWMYCAVCGDDWPCSAAVTAADDFLDAGQSATRERTR